MIRTIITIISWLEHAPRQIICELHPAWLGRRSSRVDLLQYCSHSTTTSRVAWGYQSIWSIHCSCSTKVLYLKYQPTEDKRHSRFLYLSHRINIVLVSPPWLLWWGCTYRSMVCYYGPQWWRWHCCHRRHHRRHCVRPLVFYPPPVSWLLPKVDEVVGARP